jgi:intracellular sulfur oxidation DsrE/DsrF family protein
MKSIFAVPAISVLMAGIASAQPLPEGFVTGPVIEASGPSAPVNIGDQLDAVSELKVAFDITKASEDAHVARQFETVARFLNMHVRAGLSRKQVQPAIVVHGPAADHLRQPGPDQEADDTTRLIIALIDAGVPVYLCGQTAAARGIKGSDLLPGVTLSLSAMTAHALLAQDGYSLNPF